MMPVSAGMLVVADIDHKPANMTQSVKQAR